MNTKWQCRIAPSLGGGFAGTPNKCWGTTDYLNDVDPTIFFGLYGLPDFYALWRHKGEKKILWAGSDIRHFAKGYWLDEKGEIRVDPFPLAEWINKNCENWTENIVESEMLRRFGIESKICPSFLGNIDDYPLSYKPPKGKPKLYASVSGDDFALYRWDEIDKLANKHRGIEFHLYGNTKEWKTNKKNIIVHGRVSKEIMNKEIKEMQGGLRLLPFEGFSEVIAKSILWGQWPVSTIPYMYTLAIEQIGVLKHLTEPNTKAREYYSKKFNNYPWNIHYEQ